MGSVPRCDGGPSGVTTATKTVYRFRQATAVKASLDPQAVGEELARIREVTGAGFTPAAIVEQARPETSPLHNAFSWGLTAEQALQRVLENEARYLIRHVVIYREEMAEPYSPAFFSVAIDRYESNEYLPLYEVLSDEAYRAQLVAEALKALRQWRARYHDLDELRSVFRAIDRVA